MFKVIIPPLKYDAIGAIVISGRVISFGNIPVNFI